MLSALTLIGWHAAMSAHCACTRVSVWDCAERGAQDLCIIHGKETVNLHRVKMLI